MTPRHHPSKTMRPEPALLRMVRRALTHSGQHAAAQRQSLYSLTLPGLDVRSEWRLVHDRLLDDFPAIEDVLPTTIQATVLIAYAGAAEVDGWLGSINEVILSRRLRSSAEPTATQLSASTEDDAAARC